jgi:hypothetical protein
MDALENACAVEAVRHSKVVLQHPVVELQQNFPINLA